jgi:hypothetical protein
MTIYLQSHLTLDDYRRKEAWEIYSGALTILEPLTAQQQVMTREAFDEQMLDERFEKKLLLDPDGNIRGLSSTTRDMDAVELVSNRRLDREFPEAYKNGTIWYVTFVAVPYSDEGAFVALMEHMFNQASAVDGVIAWDACDYNVFALRVGFSRAIEAYTIQRSQGTCSAVLLGAEYYFAMDVNGAHGEKGAPATAWDGRAQEPETGGGEGMIDPKDVTMPPAPTGRIFGYELRLNLGYCDPARITDPGQVLTWGGELATKLGMTPYGQPWVDRFGPKEPPNTIGVTAFCPLAVFFPITASNFVVRAYRLPGTDDLALVGDAIVHANDGDLSAFVNIFTCGVEPDVQVAVDHTVGFFRAGAAEVQDYTIRRVPHRGQLPLTNMRFAQNSARAG